MKKLGIIRSVKEQELKNYITRKHLASPGTIITDELNFIKQWVTKFQGKPVKWVYANKNHTIEIIELSFEDRDQHFYQEVSWEQWYEIFKTQQLKFIVIQPAQDDKDSRFYMLSKQINDRIE